MTERESKSTELFGKFMALKSKLEALPMLHPGNTVASSAAWRVQSLAAIVQNFPLPVVESDLLETRKLAKELISDISELAPSSLVEELRALVKETLRFKLEDLKHG